MKTGKAAILDKVSTEYLKVGDNSTGRGSGFGNVSELSFIDFFKT